jgi:hypothetical protein
MDLEGNGHLQVFAGFVCRIPRRICDDDHLNFIATGASHALLYEPRLTREAIQALSGCFKSTGRVHDYAEQSAHKTRLSCDHESLEWA